MAFALTVIELKTALGEAGCPICTQKKRGTQRSLAFYLSERYMDRPAREKLMDAYGFCPPHLFMMASQEMRSAGEPLGINLAYEQLSGRTRQALQQWQAKELHVPRVLRWLRRLLRGSTAPLPMKQPCPICASVDEHVDRALAAMMEEINRNTEDICLPYQHGDGICLPHLRQALDVFAADFPHAAEFLVQDALTRLEQQQAEMGEYIRKHNWKYRGEALTPGEERAWRKTIAFYSGYAPDAFQPFANEG